MTRTLSDLPFQSTTTAHQDFNQHEKEYTSPTQKGDILEKVELLRDKVYARRPVLASIMQMYGNKTLFEFSKSYTRTNFGFKNEDRKKEFVTIFRNEVARLLGEDVAESAEKQIMRYYTVSTAEHNAPLTHSNYLNANLITALPLLDPIDTDLQNIFVLSCANISFDNYAFPRGLLLTTVVNNQPSTNQLVFFPRNVRPCPVVYHPSYTKEAIETAKLRLSQWVREGSIKKEEELKLNQLLDEIYATDDVLNTTYFTEQITKTNFKLWLKLFEGSDTRVPNLIFLEQENIVNKLLLTHHMNTETVIGKLLFDKTYQELFLKHFDNVSNAFSLDKKFGTMYFWAIPPGKKYREQLWYDNGVLVNDAGDYRLELTPERVKTALENHELIPSTPLSFILLSFYYGLRLRGAFEQTTYLTQMKRSYIALLNEVGDAVSIEDCENTPTTTLSFIRPILALAQLPDGTNIPAGTLDLLLHGNEQYLFQIREMSKKITLDEAVTRVLPLLYKRIYSEGERDTELAEIQESEIDDALGLNKNLHPIAILGEQQPA